MTTNSKETGKNAKQRMQELTEELARANAARHESEARFRIMVDHAPEAIVVIDMDSLKTIDTNNKAEQLFGLSREKLLTLGPVQLSPLLQPDGGLSSDVARRHLAKVDVKGASVFDWVFSHASGKEIPCEVRLVRLPTAGRNLLRASIIDLTEYKRAEQALTQSEEKYRSLYDNISEGLAFIDLDGRFLNVNPAYCQMLGYSKNEMTALSVPETLAPYYRYVFDDFLAAVKKAKIYNGEVAHVHKDGRLIHAEVQGTAFKLDGKDCLFSAVRDITKRKQAEGELAQYRQRLEILVAARTAELEHEIAERKKAEHELQESEKRLHSIVDNAPVVIYVKDVQGRYSLTNLRFEELFHGPRDHFVGKTDFDVFPEEVAVALNEHDREVLKSGRDMQFEEVVIHDDGPHPYISVKFPLRNVQGKIYAVCGISSDITDRKQAELVLLRAKEAAEATSRAKSVFLANMSHELRTPLNVILGFSQLMQRDTGLSPSTKKHLTTINRSGEHLLTLINNVLEVSKIEAGRIDLNFATFDLYGLLEDVEAMFRMRAEQKELFFSVERRKDLPRYLLGDEGKIRQILINLLANAVKFTDAGGITLRVSVVKRPLPEAVQKNNSKWTLLFEVEDSGVGIDADEMDKLFQSFEQTLSGQDKGGTGLGLTICREYASLMESELAAESQPGKGSKFHFVCRIEQASEKSVGARKVEQRVVGLAQSAGPQKVLVVDDKEESRRFLAELLGLVGFATWEAGNGQEALTVFEAVVPDLVLMDMRMPVMDGYEATRRLKASAMGRQTPVIAVSASVLAEQRSEILATGADEFIHKPFRESELFDVIGKVTGIEYRYAEDEGLIVQAEEPARLTTEDLDELPDQLLVELKDALIALNVDAIGEVVERICTLNRPVGEIMRRLVKRYQFEMLLDLLKK